MEAAIAKLQMFSVVEATFTICSLIFNVNTYGGRNNGTKNGTTPAFKLVDGQQRLITVSLMLCVLRELTKVIDPTLAIDPQLPLKIEMMLVNFYETGELRF